MVDITDNLMIPDTESWPQWPEEYRRIGYHVLEITFIRFDDLFNGTNEIESNEAIGFRPFAMDVIERSKPRLACHNTPHIP